MATGGAPDTLGEDLRTTPTIDEPISCSTETVTGMRELRFFFDLFRAYYKHSCILTVSPNFLPLLSMSISMSIFVEIFFVHGGGLRIRLFLARATEHLADRLFILCGFKYFVKLLRMPMLSYLETYSHDLMVFNERSCFRL